MGDWADEKPREWYQGGQEDFRYEGPVDGSGFSSLSALLREVWEEGLKAGTTQEAEALHRADSLLAEVRRVVIEVQRDYLHDETDLAFGELLSRLEKL